MTTRLSSSSLKVAHVVRRFVSSQWGGTEASVLGLCRGLQLKDHTSPIFTTDMLSNPGLDKMDGVFVHRHPYTFPWFGLSSENRKAMELKGGSPLSISLMGALLSEPDLTVIHTHLQGRLGGIARTVARLRHIPYVVSLHAGCLTLPSQQSLEMMRPFQGAVEWGKAFGALLGARRTLDDASAIIAVGKSERNKMQELYPEKVVHYIPNGIDVSLFSSGRGERFRQQYGISPEDICLLCVSRIDTQKNQLLLTKAFHRLLKQHPKLRLILIGPATVPAYLQQIRSLSGPRVLIIEGLEVGNPLLLDAYAAANIFSLPSNNEPFGIVILEAWAAGVPVVASDVGGISGFTKDGQDILLHKPDCIESLVSVLDRLLSDTSLQKRLGEAGFSSVKPFDWSCITPHFLEVYRQVIEAKSLEKPSFMARILRMVP